jgi:autotransporter-associated beta strand protein
VPTSATAGHLVITNGTLRFLTNTTVSANRGMWIGFTNNGATIWNAVLSVDPDSTVTYNGVISNHVGNLPGADADPLREGRLIKDGAGTLVLGGVNQYQGLTAVRGGVLSVSADNSLGQAPTAATPGYLQVSNATLRATGSFALNANRGLVIAGGVSGGTIEVTTGNTVTYNGVAAGSGAFTKSGAGALALGGNNTMTGAANVTGGLLDLTADGALGSVSSVNVSGGTLRITASGAANRVNNSAPVTLAGGAIELNGSPSVTETLGVLTLTANSVIDFGTTAGTLSFANSSSATWTGGTTLSIWNWSGNPLIPGPAGGGTDQLFFGNSASGLTAGQLAQIIFYSDAGLTSLGSAVILSTGEVIPVPEPATWVCLGALTALLGWRERHRLVGALAWARR